MTELVGQNATPAAQFEEGYQTWRSDRRAGVFTGAVEQAVAGVLHVAAGLPAAQTDFDAFVRDMRAARSEAMIQELYERLFTLPEWCFLGEPSEPRSPVLWRFRTA